MGILRQKDRRMRAALSHSLSSVVGQYASLPIRETVLIRLLLVVLLLLGEGILSAHPKTLSRLDLPELALFRLRSHDGSKAETRCMLQMQVYHLGSPLNHSHCWPVRVGSCRSGGGGC